MEGNKLSIEQVFDNTDTIYTKKASHALSIILIFVGFASLFLSSQVSEANSILNPLLIVTGIALLAWGVITIPFRKTHYRSKNNNQKISFNELFFDIKERDKLIRVIKEGNTKELKNIQRSANDALKLRVALTPDGSICYCQVLTYVPFEFVNASEAIQLAPQQAQVVSELVKAS